MLFSYAEIVENKDSYLESELAFGMFFHHKYNNLLRIEQTYKTTIWKTKRVSVRVIVI